MIQSNGRIIPSDDFIPELPKDRFHTQKYFIGDSPTLDGINICTSDTIVDYGCSSFFFKTEWQKYFWKIWPCTFQTGEDIHLSGTCKIGANIPTIVPKQESVENSGNLMPFYSIDEHASWKHKKFIFERKRVFEYLIRENKWNPLLWV